MPRPSRLLHRAAGALLLVLPAAARAQAEPRCDTGCVTGPAALGVNIPQTRGGEPRVVFGGGFHVAQPVKEFRQFVVNGWGGAGYLLWRADPAGAFGWRLDAGGVNYGRERQDVDLFGRLNGELTTSNNIFWLGAGPQVMWPAGPVRPYATGAFGLAVFNTSTTLKEEFTRRELASESNQSDATWAWSGGGGLLVRVANGVALDLGARYHRNGRVSYLREGGIRDLPNGDVELNVVRSQANLWTYQVGLAFGIGVDRPRR